MTITRAHVITVMLMALLWITALMWIIGCDRAICVSNLDDANAAESTPIATPSSQLPTSIKERR